MMSKKFKIELYETDRGFIRGDFDDFYGSRCSIQESSLATDAALWLGVLEGSKDYRSDNDRLSYRLHLNQKQGAELIPLLEYFVKTGELPRKEK